MDLVTGLEQRSFVLFLEENYLYGLMKHVFLDYIYFFKIRCRNANSKQIKSSSDCTP